MRQVQKTITKVYMKFINEKDPTPGLIKIIIISGQLGIDNIINKKRLRKMVLPSDAF